jgi:hypothetical protein
MAKRWSKGRAGTQKPRRPRGRPAGFEASAARGTMGGLRRGLRGFFGTGKSRTGASTPLDRVFNLTLWLAVGAAAYFAYLRRCAG